MRFLHTDYVINSPAVKEHPGLLNILKHAFNKIDKNLEDNIVSGFNFKLTFPKLHDLTLLRANECITNYKLQIYFVL